MVSVMLYPCILCVALLVYLFVLCVACLTVFDMVAIVLLNVMAVFSVGGGGLLDRPCMVFQEMCVLCLWSQCASKRSFHRFCLYFVCR